MRFSIGPVTALALALSLVSDAVAKDVSVEVTRAVECARKTQKGDKISVHYRGTLQSSGEQFDASYDRGTPLTFVVGQGAVIKGWDENLLGMCIGEKRTLIIPPEHGYGDRAMGPIPAKSTLIFETELMGVDGVEAPESEEANVKGSIKSKIADAAEAIKVTLQDSDEDGQEHNEL